MSPLTTYLVESLIGLVLIGAIGAAVVWWGRRTGMGQGSGPLRLVARLRLDARRALYLVRLGDVVYVLGASESGLAKLGELPASAVPDADVTPASPLVLPFLRRALPSSPAELAPGKDLAS